MDKWLIIAGLSLAAIGAVLRYAPWALDWFGRLPGDIRIESANGRVFIPVTSMILVSLVITLLINLLRR